MPNVTKKLLMMRYGSLFCTRKKINFTKSQARQMQLSNITAQASASLIQLQPHIHLYNVTVYESIYQFVRSHFLQLIKKNKLFRSDTSRKKEDRIPHRTEPGIIRIHNGQCNVITQIWSFY